MNIEKIKINSFEKITTKTINHFTISLSNFILFTSVDIIILLYNNDIIVDVITLKLEGDAYTNWLNDDQYLIDYVKITLGFTDE